MIRRPLLHARRISRLRCRLEARDRMRLRLRSRRVRRSQALNRRLPTHRHPHAEAARRRSPSALKPHECEQLLVRFREIPQSTRRQLRFRATRFPRYRSFPANRRARRALPKVWHVLGRDCGFRRLVSRWRRARFLAYRQAFARLLPGPPPYTAVHPRRKIPRGRGPLESTRPGLEQARFRRSLVHS